MLKNEKAGQPARWERQAGLEKAAEDAKVGLEYYPESIPLQVYRHKLTNDAAEKKQLHYKPLKEYPSHRMVKQFLKR